MKNGWHQEQVEAVFILFLLAAVLAIVTPVVGVFIAPLATAITFTTIFYPVYQWLVPRLWRNRVAASVLVCLLVVLILLLPAYVLVQTVGRQITDIYQWLQPLVQELMEHGSESRLGEWFQQLPLAVIFSSEVIDWSGVIQQMVTTLGDMSRQIIERTSAGAFGFLIDIVIILFTMFYLFLDGKRIMRRILLLVPLREEYRREITVRFGRTASATIVGTLLVGVIQGVVGSLTLLVFGIQSWLFWGFVMLVISIIPLIGPPIILVPAGVYQILMGNVGEGIGILFSSFIIVSAIDFFLRPRIVGQRAHIHDLLIFFTTLGGLSIFGIWGFIIGPAVSALLMAVLEIVGRKFSKFLEDFNQDRKKPA